jgi:hypothetical protein
MRAATLLLAVALAAPIAAQSPASPPAAAAPEPVRVSAEDQQAIVTAMQDAASYELAIAALREKADAAAVAGQRALAVARAKHPDMDLDIRTWTYTPKAKPAAEKKGGGGLP